MLADIDGRSSYDHLFNSGLSISKIKDAALGGRLFDLDISDSFASSGVPGRSLAWKVQHPFLYSWIHTDFVMNLWRFFLLQLILSTLNPSYPPIQLHTGVPLVLHGSNSQIYCLRRCAHQTGATRTDLLYLVVRNCLHAQSNLEIWSSIILSAYMTRYVCCLSRPTNSILGKMR